MDTTEESLVRIAVELSLVPGVGTLTQGSLWKACPQLHDLMVMNCRELESYGVAPEAASAIQTRRYRSMAEEIMDWMRREACRVVIRGGADTQPFSTRFTIPR